MRTIKTIESDRYEDMDDNIHVKHVGMITYKDAFDQLHDHLKEVNLLPDEYFVPSISNQPDEELPDFRTAICHTDWGGSEGIYIDIMLLHYENWEPKLYSFATGKTLSSDGEAFMQMSRIAAECSMMLNGRGFLVKVPDHYYETDKALAQDKPSLSSQIQTAAMQSCNSHSELDEKIKSPDFNR